MYASITSWLDINFMLNYQARKYTRLIKFNNIFTQKNDSNI